MYQDAIVEEIHRIREEYSRSFNHNLKALFADLQKQQAEGGRKVVNLSRRRGLIGIGRILTNPPSHTTHRAAPQWAVLNLPARRSNRLLTVTLGVHPKVANREQSLLC